ncbi:beta-L-arabinofuranosidase domain-containing protein [Coprococcus catus]
MIFTEKSPEKIVKEDLDAVYIGNLNTVEADLDLPLQGKNGAKFRWDSGEERFISDGGKVHRPLYGMGNRKVILRVTASWGGYSEVREFEVTVLQEKRETIITKIYEVKCEVTIGEKAELPSVVIAETKDGRTLTVPVKWEQVKMPDKEGTACVKGTVEGTGKEAHASVHYNRKKKETVDAPKKKAEYVPIRQVRLSPGTLYYERQQEMLEYLLHVDDDQILYNFRQAAALDTRGAQPMTGWDEESCKLKGHTTGHYLSGLALAFGASGNAAFQKKIDYMVSELEKCHMAMAKSGKYHKGFLSAYSEEQFDLLEKYTRYPAIWAPYYTLDKIMSGLYDCYQIGGSKKAMSILAGMGDWVYERLSRLPKETLDKMWSMYIAGEFGGMLGTMVKLYQITGKEEHLKAARLFANEKLFYPMEEGCDTLEDMHANQHIPQIMGAMDLFQTTGEEKYWKIGKNFWDIVTGGHVYCIGGTGETEMFHRAGTTCSYLTEKAAESCASYNMLRLTSQIFSYTLDGSMMDYYDNTLRNHILTSSSHKADGGTTYFMPLGPGQCKVYSTTENTCCHGTGMESRFRYMENIYTYNKEEILVNLFIDSVLDGEEKLEISTNESDGIVKILCGKNMDRHLKIHIPSWGVGEFTVWINQTEIRNKALEKGYLSIPEYLKKGDEILIHLPMEFRIVEHASDSNYVNLAYGPYILAAQSDKGEFFALPKLERFQPEKESLHFEADGIKFIPFPEIDEEQYHVYFLAPEK